MSPELYIAIRYLTAKRKGLFTIIVTLIGILGVALGVAALIITLSIMNGFQSDIKQKILDAQAHIIVYGNIDNKSFDEIKEVSYSLPQIEKISPFMLGQAILSTGAKSIGVVVKGIKIPDELEVNNLKKTIKYGNWESISSNDANIILGEELAKNLAVWLGDEIILVSPKVESVFLGIVPKMKKFKVTGIINTGYYEFDNTFAYCNIKDATKFFSSSDMANGVGIKLKNIEYTYFVVKNLKKKFGFNYVVKTYADMNKNLFSALKLEKFMMSLILALIIIVATFTIASNLIMMSIEKIRDIGILRAMGATPSFIKKVFLFEGMIIASLGIVLGLILGVGISLSIKFYPIIELPSDIYYITKVPVKIELIDVMTTVGISFILCVLSAIFPAYRASRIDPIEAIRYG